MKFQGIAWLLPDWVMVWLVVAAVVALCFRRWRIAFGLMAIPIAVWFVSPVFRSMLSQWSIWAQILVYATFGLLAIQAILMIVFGREAAAEVIGRYIVKLPNAVFGVAKWVVLAVKWLLTKIRTRNLR